MPSYLLGLNPYKVQFYLCRVEGVNDFVMTVYDPKYSTVCQGLWPSQRQAYSFSSLFTLDVATKSQKDHNLFSATYIYVPSKKNGN
jgi:hypothetical protein